MKPSLFSQRSQRAFTLVEMLVVLGIIVIILGIAIPSLRHKEGVELDAAARQLAADLNMARNRAINGRTTVAVVFVPSLVTNIPATDDLEGKQIKQLQAGIYTHYALFATRKAGDQPGQPHFRYLTKWYSLPEKTFISESMFTNQPPPTAEGFPYAMLPFPATASTYTNWFPYVAFNCEGRPVFIDGTHLTLPEGEFCISLSRGAIFYTRDAQGKVIGYSVQEVPPGQSVATNHENMGAAVHVAIDATTGRAKVEQQELK